METAKWEAQRPADRPFARHSEEMSALERDRFSLAKTINDLETTILQYESMLAAQKASLTSLQAENAKHSSTLSVGGGASRLEIEWNFFRDLGIEWLPEDQESSGEGRIKCRVKDSKKNDIFTAILDDGKMSSVEQANLLWSMCCQ